MTGPAGLPTLARLGRSTPGQPSFPIRTPHRRGYSVSHQHRESHKPQRHPRSRSPPTAACTLENLVRRNGVACQHDGAGRVVTRTRPPDRGVKHGDQQSSCRRRRQTQRTTYREGVRETPPDAAGGASGIAASISSTGVMVELHAAPARSDGTGPTRSRLVSNDMLSFTSNWVRSWRSDLCGCTSPA